MSKLTTAMRILRSFGTSTPELGVSQLAQELDLPKSSVSRLMKEMKEQDLLSQDPDTKRFRPGFFLYHLGNVFEDNLLLFRGLVAKVQDLVNDTGHTGFIGLVDGKDIIALKSIQGKHSFRYSWNAGYRMPAHSITGGICLLSRMTDDEVRALYKDQFNAFYPRAPQSLDELLEVLQQVRSQGWIELDMSSVSDVRAIGVSIASADGKEAYGYSLSFPAGSLSPAGAMELRDQLVRSAQELGSQFGDRFWTRMEVA